MTWRARGLLLRAAWLLVLAALLASVALLVYRDRVLPVTDGTLAVTGLGATVRIERDADGVPTIRAGSARDALFGLGFVHAQDRLWQLETHKRIGSGRLAEALGEPALETDKFLRSLGVRRAAQAQWAAADADTRAAFEAYTAGINGYLAEHLRARPPEFVLLGVTPEPWTPVDSVAWSIMMAWDLGANWSTELLRMRLALRMPVARIQALLPPYPGEAPLATADYAALYRGLAVSDALPQRTAEAAQTLPGGQGVEGLGSNNWAVDGARSATGAPLLANDPHLKLSTPSLWYLARLEAPGLTVAGATMPGLPVVVLGQNEHIAWGFTNTNPDVQDLYLERIDPADPTRYQTPDGWQAFERFEERIKVKGGDEVRYVARRTRHGPVLSDAGTGATDGLTGAAAKPAFALALRWTALDADAGTLAAGLAFNRAGSVDAFVEAARRYTAPMQSMLVADRHRIAFVAAGRVPVRGPRHDLRGLVPAPGWDARYDWQGTLGADDTPREVDPARGWLATANQRIHGPDYPHFLTSEWTVPYRQQRIEALLQARPTHDLDSFAAMQADLLSPATLRVLPHLQRAVSAHPLAAEAKRLLADFDGTMAADRPQPLLVWAWLRHLTAGVFADDVGSPLFERQIDNRSFREALERVLDADDVSWCDDLQTASVETCAQQTGMALGRALDELEAAHGDDVGAWRWGDAHQARAEHRPFSKLPPLARWFELRSPVGGDTYTINVSRVSLKPDGVTGELYLNEHGPGLRALYDLADPARSRVIQSSGQSGIVLSPHYGSLLERWARGGHVPLWRQDDATGGTLSLVPR